MNFLYRVTLPNGNLVWCNTGTELDVKIAQYNQPWKLGFKIEILAREEEIGTNGWPPLDARMEDR